MIEAIVQGRDRGLGEGFTVKRVLPVLGRRNLGPFVFVDHFGPRELGPEGMAVRPHPHIGLATVTYLFEGRIMHRDSLGVQQPIEPGAINWMTAGRGITHSERSEGFVGRMHGLQLWVALPEGDQEREPAFTHTPAEDLPVWDQDGARIRLLVGSWLGRRSPVAPTSETLYAELVLSPGAKVALPRSHTELGVLAVEGDVRVHGQPLGISELAVLSPGAAVVLEAEAGARVVLLGGEPLGPRHMWWNFVHTDRERIEQAKADWAQGRFPQVPGDPDTEALPG